MRLKKMLTFIFIWVIIMSLEVREVDSSFLTKERKIEVFIRHNSSLTTEKAKYLAERFMQEGYPAAKWLAATAKVESDFTFEAVGKSGERSMFQILKWPKHKNPLNINHAIEEALKVRKEKQLTWKGSEFKALQAYNGNPKLKQTKLYAKKIESYMRHL